MKLLITLLILLYSSCACSAIQIERSRVIYSGDHKSAALEIHNESKDNYIVQSWLDDDAGKSEKTMVVTPPLLKLLPDQSATLRFVYSGSGLPADRESVIWVNVQEIPPRAKEPNVMQLAVRTRLKLFYRPQKLIKNASEAPEKVVWKRQGNKVTAHNATPYHVTVAYFSEDEKGEKKLGAGSMLTPGETHTWTLDRVTTRWYPMIINDYGALRPVSPDTK